MTSLADTTYTPSEDKEVLSWAEFATNLKHNPTDAAALDKLNTHLATRTTLLGAKPSSADISVYQALSPSVTQWTPEQRTGENGRPNIVRLLDFIQNSPIYGFNPETKITVNPDEILYVKPPVDAKAEKERLKKEKAAAVAAEAGGDKKPEEDKSLVDRTKEKVEKAKDKVVAAAEGTVDAAKKQKQKKEKQPKPQKAPAVASPPKPSLIDLRVGHILKAIKHPEADSLYVSTIAVGDPAGTEDTTEYEGQVCRTVCSGLNGLVPLEEMQGRKVVTVCNLKPVKMRGIKSCAMVLAASPRLKEGEVDDHKGPVELVNPPEGAKTGERVCFEGFEGEPEGVLNPKKKIWEMFQPGFTTTDSLEVAFDASVVKELGQEGVGKLVTKDGGMCTVKTLKDAVVR